MRRQDKHLRKLARSLESAQAAETAAGAKIADLMREAGIPLRLDTAGSKVGIRRTTKALARKGVRRKKLKPVLRGLLRPGPVDWLAAIEQGSG